MQRLIEEKPSEGPSTVFFEGSANHVRTEQPVFAPLRLRLPKEFGGKPEESTEDLMDGMNTYLDAVQCPKVSRGTLASAFLRSIALEWFNLRKMEDQKLPKDWTWFGQQLIT